MIRCNEIVEVQTPLGIVKGFVRSIEPSDEIPKEVRIVVDVQQPTETVAQAAYRGFYGKEKP